MTREIATAVATTEAALSARVWRRRFIDPPPPPERDFAAAVDEGVTDFALRRTRVSAVDDSGVDAVAAFMEKRWPWLALLDEEEDASADGEQFEWVYAGTAGYLGNGEFWAQIGDGDPASTRRGHNDPLWIVDLLRHADEAWPRERSVVRGAACERVAFRVAASAHRDEVERVTGEVAIDAEGRIRQVTWSPIPRGRKRGPAARRPSSRMWQTTELWDFGVAADIPLPQTRERPSRWWAIDAAEFARELWAARRDYKRR
jgi:hypothetical protein